MFAAFLKIEYKPIVDRYSEHAVVKIINLDDSFADAMQRADIPTEIAIALRGIVGSPVYFSSIAIVVEEWSVKTSIVNNTLPTD